MPPRITVLIPMYNGKARIEMTIESLIAQSDQRFNLVLSDNCSTDNSPEIALDKLSRADFSYEVFTQSLNLGWLGNFRFLHERVATDYFVFLDSEDILSENFIEVFYRAIEKSETADVLFPNYIELGKNGIEREINAQKKVVNVPYPYRLPYYASLFSMAGAGYLIFSIQHFERTKLIWKKLLDITVPTPTKWLVEDISLSWAIIGECKNLIHLDLTTLRHFSKAEVNEDRILLNELPLEAFYAVSSPEIMYEAYELFCSISSLPQAFKAKLGDVLKKNYELVALQQGCAKMLLEF